MHNQDHIFFPLVNDLAFRSNKHVFVSDAREIGFNSIKSFDIIPSKCVATSVKRIGW